MLVAVLAVGLLAQVVGYDDYLEGLRLIEEGRGVAARASLERVLKQHPEPVLRARITEESYVEYLPHLYLAVACHMAGDVAAAREHLKAAEARGVETQSEVGRSLSRSYHILLGVQDSDASPPPPAAAAGAGPTRYDTYARKPTVLSNDEHQRLRGEVLSRCHLRANTADSQAPWYFHYELGERLAQRGDPQRALDAFIEAAERRPRSQREARLYGMWFTRYLPYLQIAREHARLQNWDCAADALAVSEREREVSAEDPEAREFADLRQIVMQAIQKERP